MSMAHVNGPRHRPSLASQAKRPGYNCRLCWHCCLGWNFAMTTSIVFKLKPSELLTLLPSFNAGDKRQLIALQPVM